MVRVHTGYIREGATGDGSQAAANTVTLSGKEPLSVDMSVDLCDLAKNPAQSWKQCGVEHSPYPCTCDTYVKYGAPGVCGCIPVPW